MSNSSPVEPSGPLSPAELAALVRADQYLAWQRQQPVDVEDYLGRYSALQGDPALVLDLIHTEVLLREQSGETPQLEEYLQRFPQHADPLRRRFLLHHAVRAAGLPQAGQRPAPPRVPEGDTTELHTLPPRVAASVATLPLPPSAGEGL